MFTDSAPYFSQDEIFRVPEYPKRIDLDNERIFIIPFFFFFQARWLANQFIKPLLAERSEQDRIFLSSPRTVPHHLRSTKERKKGGGDLGGPSQNRTGAKRQLQLPLKSIIIKQSFNIKSNYCPSDGRKRHPRETWLIFSPSQATFSNRLPRFFSFLFFFIFFFFVRMSRGVDLGSKAFINSSPKVCVCVRVLRGLGMININIISIRFRGWKGGFGGNTELWMAALFSGPRARGKRKKKKGRTHPDRWYFTIRIWLLMIF